MEETATITAARPGGHIETPTAFDLRAVCNNTHPRANPEIDLRDYNRGVEVFERVLGS